MALALALSATAATGYVVAASYVLGGTVSAAVPGWRTVSYRGVSLQFPASWPVVDLGAHPAACPRLDVHAVYLGTAGPHPACPASGLAAKTENVQITAAVPGTPEVLTATRAVTVGGVAARTNPAAALGHTITDVFPASGMLVDLSYGRNPALVRRVQSTIKVAAGSPRSRPLASMPLSAVPAGQVQGTVKGYGFDACAAPSFGTIRAWHSSPYRSVGVYIGGADRACSQPNLSAWWINRVERAGWHVFPIYVGPQAPCVDAPGNLTFSAGRAAAAGTASAVDAAIQARSLRLPAGTPLIYDMESYSGCGSAVTRFVNAWDRKLRAKGYRSGVYESFGDISDLIHAKRWIKEPDVIFYASWDGHATTNSPYMPSRMWTNHQRIHQYTGNTYQTFGGITLNIDKDKMNVNLGRATSPPPPSDPPTRPEAAVVAQGGTVRVYVHANRGPMWENQLAAGSGWASDNLHGFWPSDPAAVVGKDGTVRVYATGTNSVIFEKHLSPGGTWSKWWGMGGKWPWSPAAVVGPDGMVHVFAVGTNGRLFEDHLAPGGAWSGWRSRGGSGLHGTPAAVVDHAGGIHVFARAANRTLREARLVPGSGWAWTNLHGTWPFDAGAVADAGGTVRAYAVGTNGRLFEDRLRRGGSWSGWRSRGGTTLTGIPAAVVDQAGAVRVFARAGNGTLREAHLDPGSAWALDNLHGTWALDAAAVVGADGTVRVYEAGRSGRIYEKHLSPGGTWSTTWWRMAAP